MDSAKRYYYEGPVYEFGNIIQEHWSAETVAKSDKKALSNLIFQWKKAHNRSANSYVVLPERYLDREV